MKVCPKCQSTYDDKFSFCKQCGVALINNNTNEKTTSPIAPVKENSNKNYLVIFVILIILAIAGAGFYYFSNKVQSLEKQVETQNAMIEKKQKSLDAVIEKQNKQLQEKESALATSKEEIERLNNEKVDFANDLLKSEAVNFFRNYHRAITNKDYGYAYDCLSNDMKRSLGSYNTYRNGYNTTISSNVVKATVLSVNGSTVEVEYILEARDYSKNNGTIIQNFAGTTVLQKNNGIWKIIDNRARKIR